MIKSYKDYLDYLAADLRAGARKPGWLAYWKDDVWRFQCLLRKSEYWSNCFPGSFMARWYSFRMRQLGRKLGFSIPPNVFGPGLSIAHAGTVVVNDGARVGANCRLHVCVVIGTEAGKSRAVPQIGENCYIGPGSKIFGQIRIGDNVAIGANAVVKDSFPEGNMTIAGMPARKVSNKTSEGLLIKGWLR